MFLRSIRAKLNASTFVCLIIVVALATVAILGLQKVDAGAEALATKWVAGSQLLGDLSDEISEFRLAETWRALATDPEAAAKAERLAGEHAAAIEEDIQLYRALVGSDFMMAECQAFRLAWNNYMIGHQAWVAGDASLTHDEPATPGSVLNNLYQAADQAGDLLIDRNKQAALDEAAAANRAAKSTVSAVLVAAICAGLLTVLMLAIVERRVQGPLAAITTALASLASGNRAVQVPGADRSDEIGAMARALEVFRSNAILARHDPLTGLPNRRLFASELNEAMSATRQGTGEYAVMLIDLDRFKPINDLYGHAIGDFVLCEVAARLKDLVLGAGIAARLGGDEFAVLMRSSGDRKQRDEAAIRLAGKILTALTEPVVSSETALRIGASIGIALCPEDGSDADAVLRAADLAMYRAKQDGRSTFRFFEQSMDAELRDRAALEADLRKAVDDNQIQPFFQPLVSIEDESIRGFEVLARWSHVERGFIPPDVFIPLIEQLGLMPQFTSSILRQACRDARGWSEDVFLTVNITPTQFQDPSLPLSIAAVLHAEDFPPSRLELEVTESALVGDIEQARATLSALQSVGIRVALDDFGTGYSSLYHLRELKFDKIKIDRSFVQSMETNSESQKIVDAVLGLARSLDMTAVAEGVEDQSTMRMLADRKCPLGQGYLFSRAVTAHEAKQLLARESHLRAA